jgi:hypothetical protein
MAVADVHRRVILALESWITAETGFRGGGLGRWDAGALHVVEGAAEVGACGEGAEGDECAVGSLGGGEGGEGEEDGVEW